MSEPQGTKCTTETPPQEEKCVIVEKKSRNYKILVLPGGGIKGYTLLGAIQAFIDTDMLSIETYIGTSVGAIIGYLLAIGYSPIEIVVALHTNRWMEKMRTFNLVNMMNGEGALSFAPISEAIEKLTLDKIGKLLTLGNLQRDFGKTLICCTYNMTTCETEYLSPESHPDLPCLIALRMTANIPLVFGRFKYTDNYYIDGGICDNFPINYAFLRSSKDEKSILGIFMDITEKTLKDDPKDGILAYFFRLFQIPILQTTKFKVELVKDNCDIVRIITDDLRSGVEFETSSRTSLDMFSVGYSQGKKFLE